MPEYNCSKRSLLEPWPLELYPCSLLPPSRVQSAPRCRRGLRVVESAAQLDRTTCCGVAEHHPSTRCLGLLRRPLLLKRLEPVDGSSCRVREQVGGVPGWSP